MLPDDGPVPQGQWYYYDYGTYILIEGTFDQALTDDMACTPSNFQVLIDGSPRTINSVGTNLAGLFQLNVALPLPVTDCFVSMTHMDNNLTRESDGYLVFPWGSREAVYSS